MYDELIKNLRGRSQFLLPHYGEETSYDSDLMKQAADAIEELAAFKVQITDGHFYCMRGGVLYEAKVEPPKGKVFQLPPIEFAGEGE